MKVEMPELRRCCFCIPLRYGLLACGYIKLTITLLMLISIIIRMAEYHFDTSSTVIASFFIVLLLVDITLTVLFVIGGHKKTVQLLRVFYIYSIVILCIFGVFFGLSSAIELYQVEKYLQTNTHPDGHFLMLFIIQIKLYIGFFSFGLQMYIILLIRSEINKLRNNSSYRFTNIAAEQSEVENGSHGQDTKYETVGTNAY